VAFGTSVVALRIALVELSPTTAALLRVGTAALAFALLGRSVRSRFPRGRRAAVDVVVAGVLNIGLPLLLFSYALQGISSGMLGVLLALSPTVTATLARVLLPDEPISRARVAGLALGLGGLLVLILTRATGLQTADGAVGVISQLLAVAGIVSSAFGSVYSRRRLAEFDNTATTAGQTAVGFVLIAVVAASQPSEIDVSAVSVRAWAAVLYSGLAGSLLGYWLRFRTIQRHGPVSASFANYVEPLVSTGLGAVLLGGIRMPSKQAGAMLILAGVATVTFGGARQRWVVPPATR